MRAVRRRRRRGCNEWCGEGLWVGLSAKRVLAQLRFTSNFRLLALTPRGRTIGSNNTTSRGTDMRYFLI